MNFDDVVRHYGSIRAAIQEYGSIRAASRGLGIPRTTLRRYIEKDKLYTEKPKNLESESPRTSDALTDVCEAMNIKQGEVRGAWLKTEEASVWVRRDPTKSVEELSPDFVALLDSARRHVVRPAESVTADSMLFVSLHDAHFGRLSFFKEAGDNYDPGIAATIYKQAVADSLSFFNPTRIKKIIFPIGSDLLHTDNLRSETTSGTRVDSVDTRIHNVFDIAVSAVIAAIEDCLTVADVDVIWIPGNHDELLSGMLAKVIKQYFRFDNRVNVDDVEVSRKVVHWGTNLIMISHRFNKPQNAPLTLATEYPREWGMTTCREIHHGHWHTQKSTQFSPYFEVSGVIVRCLPSLCSADKWHFDNQFTENVRAAESHLYSEETGYIGSHLARIRDNA